MPYKVIGKTVYTKKSGKWKKKQTCKSIAAAKRAKSLLEGIEHGKGKGKKAWKPTGKKPKTRRRKKK